MMARLVSVSILADETGNVRRRLRSLYYGRNREERVQLAEEGLLAAEALYQSSEIMRHQPCVLPAVALAIIISTMCGCKRAVFLTEPSLAVLASDESQGGVKQFLI